VFAEHPLARFGKSNPILLGAPYGNTELISIHDPLADVVTVDGTELLEFVKGVAYDGLPILIPLIPWGPRINAGTQRCGFDFLHHEACGGTLGTLVLEDVQHDCHEFTVHRKGGVGLRPEVLDHGHQKGSSSWCVG